MAKLLFGILVIMEIALVVFTLAKQKSRKEWVRNRLVTSGAELLLFLCMTLLPGIDLSFRFIGLCLLLCLRLFFSGLRFLIHWWRITGEKKAVVLILGACVRLILIYVFMVPAFVFADYNGRPVTGQYSTELKKVILVDQSREESFETDGSKREVPLYFFYPKEAAEGQKFPLVIFSHGAIGYYESNTSTYMELVSHGYVVVSMEHPYHSLFTYDTGGNLITVNPQFINDALTIGNKSSIDGTDYEKTKEWISLRALDMNFAIDAIKEAQRDKAIPADRWYLCDGTTESDIQRILGLMDCDKIGVMGHSMGGATAVAIGRQRDDISAVIDLDGTMLSERIDFADGAYVMQDEAYPVPLLSMDNEGHYKDGQEYGSYYVNNVVIDNARDGQHSYIVGAEHMNFTDLPLFSPALGSALGTGSIDAGRCIDIVNEIVLRYMDSYLKGEGDYRVEEYYQ